MMHHDDALQSWKTKQRKVCSGLFMVDGISLMLNLAAVSSKSEPFAQRDAAVPNDGSNWYQWYVLVPDQQQKSVISQWHIQHVEQAFDVVPIQRVQRNHNETANRSG